MKERKYDMAHRFQGTIDTWPGKHIYAFHTYQGKASGSKKELYEVMRRMGREFRILEIREKGHPKTQVYNTEIHYEVIK